MTIASSPQSPEHLDPPKPRLRRGLTRLALASAVAVPAIVVMADVAEARIALNHNEAAGRDTPAG